MQSCEQTRKTQKHCKSHAESSVSVRELLHGTYQISPFQAVRFIIGPFTRIVTIVGLFREIRTTTLIQRVFDARFRVFGGARRGIDFIDQIAIAIIDTGISTLKAFGREQLMEIWFSLDTLDNTGTNQSITHSLTHKGSVSEQND
jgi:hypothetical protein